MHPNRSQDQKDISRRKFITSLTVMAGGALLAACRNQPNFSTIFTTPTPRLTILPENPSATPPKTPTVVIQPSKSSTPQPSPSPTVTKPGGNPHFSYDRLSVFLSDKEIDFLASHEIISGDTLRPVVMMTYDDVMNEKKLDTLLDVYAEAGVKTTFFFIGINLKSVANSVPRVVAEGHTVGCHGWTHDVPFVALSDADINKQFQLFTKTIGDILPGYRVRYFRAPFGSRDDRVIKLAAQWGMQHVLWSQESGGKDRQTYHYVVDRVKNGAIVLSHASRYYDVTEADGIVRELIRKGYSLESLDTGISPSDRWTG